MSKKKDEKKVRRRKVRKTLDKRIKNPKAGRPTLEEKELDELQKQFAELVGRLNDSKLAAEIVGFTDYQRKRYLELPKMKEEIRKWKRVFGKIGVERMIALVDELNSDVINEMRRRVKEGKLSEGTLMKLFNKSLFISGVVEPETSETQTLTERRGGRQALTAGKEPKGPVEMGDDSDGAIERTVKKEVKKGKSARKMIDFDSDDDDEEDNDEEEEEK